jgi:hypothetical protein
MTSLAVDPVPVPVLLNGGRVGGRVARCDVGVPREAGNCLGFRF